MLGCCFGAIITNCFNLHSAICQSQAHHGNAANAFISKYLVGLVSDKILTPLHLLDHTFQNH